MYTLCSILRVCHLFFRHGTNGIHYRAFGIKRYRSVAAVCAIYPDAHTVETYLYLKLTSFCVHILIIVLVRVLVLVKLTFWTAISAHQVIISVSVWYGKYTTHWLKT